MYDSNTCGRYKLTCSAFEVSWPTKLGREGATPSASRVALWSCPAFTMNSTSVTDIPRPPLPLAYSFVPQLTLALVIALRPPFVWRFLTWAVITVALLRAVRLDVGTKSYNYLTGGAFGATSFHALVLLLLSDPTAEWRHETQSVIVAEMPLRERVYNSACILVNLRGIGWTQQVRVDTIRCTRIAHSRAKL